SALPSGPLVAISDISITQVGQSLTVDAKASFDPRANDQSFTYDWDFGDGNKSNGVTTSHSYTKAGTYTLTLSVTAPTGTRSISKPINVTTQATTYFNPYAGFAGDGNPPINPQVHLPQADDALLDRIVSSSELAQEGAKSWGLVTVVIVIILV